MKRAASLQHALLISMTGLVLLTLGAASARGQEGLTVTIMTDRDVYDVGDEVNVTFTLDNQTGQTIRLEGTSCVPLFDLIVLDASEQQIWKASDCPSCCCTCCRCPIRIVRREIPTGVTQYPNDGIWRQVRIVDRGRCGCITAQVEAGVYYLVGKVGKVMSEPVAIEIR